MIVSLISATIVISMLAGILYIARRTEAHRRTIDEDIGEYFKGLQ